MADEREVRFAELYAPLITCCLDTVFVSACMTRAGASNPDRLLRDFQEALRLAAKQWQSLDADSDTFSQDVHDVLGGSPQSGGALLESAVNLFGSEAAATYAAREALLEAARDVFNQPWVMMRLQCNSRLELRDTVTAALLRTVTFIVLPDGNAAAGTEVESDSFTGLDQINDIDSVSADSGNTRQMDTSCADTMPINVTNALSDVTGDCARRHEEPARSSRKVGLLTRSRRIKRGGGGDTFF